jgi:hypothetical protein
MGAAAGAGARVPDVAVPGCVIDRSMGLAAFGAVCVVGGLLNVRPPRLPPPPTLASATLTMKARVAVSARVRPLKRENDMRASLDWWTPNPYMGSAEHFVTPLHWDAPQQCYGVHSAGLRRGSGKDACAVGAAGFVKVRRQRQRFAGQEAAAASAPQ